MSSNALVSFDVMNASSMMFIVFVSIWLLCCAVMVYFPVFNLMFNDVFPFLSVVNVYFLLFSVTVIVSFAIPLFSLSINVRWYVFVSVL